MAAPGSRDRVSLRERSDSSSLFIVPHPSNLWVDSL